MAYWDMVLDEVLSPDNERRISFTNIADIKAKKSKSKLKSSRKRSRYMCKLGNNYPGIYFTRREAECMWHLIQGKTIKLAAAAMQLSCRTIEFYLENMKKKIDCKTKPELIELILQTDFLRSFAARREEAAKAAE